MKLAEALVERADLQRRFKEVQVRINANTEVEEGETPKEDITELLIEAKGIANRLATLITAVNKTNSTQVVTTKPYAGFTIMELLAKRDSLAMVRNLLQGLITQGAYNPYARVRATKDDIKIVSVVKHKEIRVEADDLAKAHRGLDTFIQSLNWTTDLIE